MRLIFCSLVITDNILGAILCKIMFLFLQHKNSLQQSRQIGKINLILYIGEHIQNENNF